MHKYNKMKGKILIPGNSSAAVPSNHLTISAIRKMGCLKTSNPFWLIVCVAALCVEQAFLVGCVNTNGWSKGELKIINEAVAPMRVLTVDNPADSLVLRVPCTDFSAGMLTSPEYAALTTLMVATVTDPSEDGVGIAGPQVGISRRIVAVQRFDKPSEPFEVYPNIRIIATRGDLCPGPEGCLSVPGRRGTVLRYRDIDIQYTLVSPSGVSSASGALRDTVERIQGFTAVIFQHECDHLDGILYIDKLEPAL